MSSTAQIIEWIFSSPFIWMTLLGVVTAHSFRKHAIIVSMPYAPLTEEKNENRLGVRMMLSFLLGIAAALFIYFTGAALSFVFAVGIWFLALVLTIKSKEPIAFLIALLVFGTVAFFTEGADALYKPIRYAGSYQMVLGVLYLLGRKETFPIIQQEKNGEIHGEHLFKQVWLLPVVAVSMIDASTLVLSYGMIAMLLFSDIRISRTTPEKYFRRHGIFMALSGAFFTGMSFVKNEIAMLAVLFAAVPTFLIYWIVKEVRFVKRSDHIFCADDTGVQVFYVYEDTPASQMGLKPADLIISINGRRVVSPEAVETFLQDRPPYIWIEFLRDKEKTEREYKDYENGIGDLGAVFTPRHPSKFELHPRPGFFKRLVKSFVSLFVRRSFK